MGPGGRAERSPDSLPVRKSCSFRPRCLVVPRAFGTSKTTQTRCAAQVPACGGTEKAVEKQSKQPKKLHGYIFNPFEYRGTAPDTLHPYIKVHVFLIADSKGILTTERLMAQGAALVQSLVHHGSTLDVQRDAGMITSFLADCGMKHAMGNTSFCPSLSHTNKKVPPPHSFGSLPALPARPPRPPAPPATPAPPARPPPPARPACRAVRSV